MHDATMSAMFVTQIKINMKFHMGKILFFSFEMMLCFYLAHFFISFENFPVIP